MIKHILYLDVLKQGYQQHLSGFKAGEANVRELNIILTEGGRVLELCENAHAELYIVRPDGRKYHSACETDPQKNMIRHVMTTDEVLLAGLLECEVRIQFPTDGDEIIPVMYSPCFDILVDETIYSENAVISENANSEWSQTLQRISAAEKKLSFHENELSAKADKSEVEAALESKASELTEWVNEKFISKEDGAGVKPVAKTPEMTAEVGIDEDGKLWFDPFAGTPLKVESFTISPDSVEKGRVISSVDLSWKANKNVYAGVYTGSGGLDGVLGSLDYSPPATSDEFTVSDEGLEIKENGTVELILATSGGAQTAKASAGISFLNGIYMGAAPEPQSMSSAFIMSLEHKKLSGSVTMTAKVNAEGNKFIWYACPASMGEPKFISGGFEGGFKRLAGEFPFTNAHRHTENYQIWQSEQQGLVGETTVEVK